MARDSFNPPLRTRPIGQSTIWPFANLLLWRRLVRNATPPASSPNDGFVLQYRLLGVTLTALPVREIAFVVHAERHGDLAILLNRGRCPLMVEAAVPVRNGEPERVWLDPGDWMVARPAVQTRVTAEANGDLLLANFARSLWRDGEPEYLVGIPNRAANWLNRVFSDAALAIFDAAAAPLAETPDPAEALMASIRLSLPIQQSHRDRRSPPALIARIDKQIEASYKDADFDASSLARRLGLSRRRLDVVYVANNGKTVSNAILERRLLGALDEIDGPSSNRSISEIGSANGFENASHFSSRFKKRFGESPVTRRNRFKGVKFVPIPILDDYD